MRNFFHTFFGGSEELIQEALDKMARLGVYGEIPQMVTFAIKYKVILHPPGLHYIDDAIQMNIVVYQVHEPMLETKIVVPSAQDTIFLLWTSGDGKTMLLNHFNYLQKRCGTS